MSDHQASTRPLAGLLTRRQALKGATLAGADLLVIRSSRPRGMCRIAPFPSSSRARLHWCAS